MPPKRKAAGGARGAAAKKAKAAAAKPALEKKTTLQKAMSVAKKAAESDSKAVKQVKIKVDSCVPAANNFTVYKDYDAMLNQTNIGQNNNKFYVIQVLQRGSMFYSWNRWGRVGESGQNSMKHHGTSADKAVADFEKKFKDKTRNNWSDRHDFKPVKGKYTLLEMSHDDDDDEEEMEMKLAAVAGEPKAPAKVEASKLDQPTQLLMKLIFSNDMFNEALAKLKLDTKKMPLGKLSKAQIAKGFEVLDEIEKVINGSSKGSLPELCSKFYTVIPHDFGRCVPPVIRTQEALREKLDMLLVLSDIVVAQTLQKENEAKLKKQEAEGKPVPNPLDVSYQSLACELQLVDPGSEEFRIIEKYQKQTGVGTLLRAWRVDRQGEEERHVKAGDSKLDNRKLLWHGTGVAVVAAILKSGLRIMPHSGGRVGKGIYFASEHAKSACYTGRTSGNIGIMFLNEVALGKIYKVQVGNSGYTEAPKGFHSILAEGRTEPDPKSDTLLKVGKRTVSVPQGKPVQIGPQSSHFWQSEYLVYKESQCRIRYLLQMRF